VNAPDFTGSVIVNCLRAMLVLALVGAGWTLYHKLPNGASSETSNGAGAQTTLVILLRRPSDAAADLPLNTSVEIYPVDVAAVRREFFDPDNRRAGMRFEQFLSKRMKGRPPVTAQFDGRGQTSVKIAPGKWWIHATLGSTQSLEWRLPVNVSGRQQTVELTAENAYARAESF
jgi:hypothetical protein